MEGSLSGLLHGTNRILLKSQAEVDKAKRELWRIVHQVCTAEFVRWVRADVVLHLTVDCGKVTEAIRNAPHPWFRGKHRREVWQERNLRIPGYRRILQFYDPLLKDTGKPGSLTRVEVQLRGTHVAAVGDLDFSKAYGYLRSGLLSFDVPQAVTVADDSVYGFLAEIEAIGLKDGSSPLDRFLKRRRADHGKIVRRVRALMTQALPLNFAAMLPESAPVMIDAHAPTHYTRQRKETSC